jgi:8-oxo-dGTP pyrophosphatase MutT (NUDIX family)
LPLLRIQQRPVILGSTTRYARPFADPRSLPLLPTEDAEPIVHLADWSSSRLRQRFLTPPSWSPELTGDRVRLSDRQLTAAAVLVPIVEQTDGYHLLLTQRSAQLQDHAGQIAFPGGRVDPDDLNAEHTAKREALEEIGLAFEAVEVIGQLPNYTTGTGYDITPVVGLVKPDQTYVAQPDEVAQIFQVPMQFLMHPANHQRRAYQLNGAERFFYAMPYVGRPVGRGYTSAVEEEFFIWGATAAIIRNLYRFLSHSG